MESLGLHIDGPLDLHGLRTALNQTIARHEALRTTIDIEAQERIIADRGEASLQVVDLQRSDTTCHTWLQQTARYAMNLSEGPLCKFYVLRSGPQAHLLLIDAHHIIVDGLSLSTLLEEITVLYTGISQSESPRLKPAVPFERFRSAQQRYLAGEAAKQAQAFWRKAFPTGLISSELPMDVPRKHAFDYQGAGYQHQMDGPAFKRIKMAARRLNSTPFMVLLTAYLTLISRLNRRQYVLIGIPVSGRDQAAFQQGLVGYCANLLPLGLTIEPGQAFVDLLAAVKTHLFDMLDHQSYPFDNILRDFNYKADIARPGAISLCFNVDSLQETPQMAGLSCRLAELPRHYAKFDVLLDILDMGDQGACFKFEYASSAFKAETIERYANAYLTLLDSICSAPHQAVAQLDLLDEAQVHLAVDHFNQTEAAYDLSGTLLQGFERQVDQNPHRIALRFEDQTLDYGGLEARSNQLAHSLIELGVTNDDVVAILAERSLEMVIAIYAILKAGAAYLPLDPQSPDERLRFQVEDADASILLLEGTAPPKIRPQTQVLDLSDPGSYAEDQRRPRVQIDPQNAAYVIYTSGSTGRPKGVVNSHAGIVNRLAWKQDCFGLTPEDRVLHKTPYTFDVSVWELFWPLMVGAEMVIARPRSHGDPFYLTELIDRCSITTLHFVPSMLGAFVQEADATRCRSLRRVLCSGEALPADLVRSFYQVFDTDPQLHNLYGPTEAAIDVSWYPCEPEIRRGVPIGRAIANTQLYVLDPHMRPLPIGVPGELYIGGVQLARGYLGRPGLTAQTFVCSPFGKGSGERLYKTGDLVRQTDDGQIWFLGRIDFQVKLRGQRIELGEIETVLQNDQDVSQAAVLLDDGNQRLIAYYVGAVSAQALGKRLSAHLPEYMVPQDFVSLSNLPLSVNGKVDRKALAAITPTTRETRYEPPVGSLEETVASIWRSVLKVAKVGRNDDFFRLGGQSLLAIQVVAAIRRRLQVTCPMPLLFDAPVLSQFAQHLASLEPEQDGSTPLTKRGETGPAALSFSQQQLWFLEQLNPSHAYHMPASLFIEGALDIQALDRAICAIQERHEILRTTFCETKGQPVQIIHPKPLSRLQIIDLRHHPEEAQALAHRETTLTFDLETGPIWRLYLLILGPRRYRLLSNMHHILSDGWSMGLLAREFHAFYAHFAHGQALALPTLEVQYADYAHWHNQRLHERLLEEHLAWWREQLDGAPPMLNLPTDRTRGSQREVDGDLVTFTLGAELVAKLERLGHQNNSTLFMNLLAAFSILLGRHADQSDMLIGTPVAGRHAPETEDLIGFFVNTLVMRIRLDGHAKVASLLEHVRSVALGAFAHGDVPFERLIQELQPDRDLSLNPLFQVMFILQNTPDHALVLPGLETRLEERSTQASTFDLTLTVIPQDRELRCEFEYSRALFDRARIAGMAEHFRTLLEAMVDHPATPVAYLPLYASKDRETLLAQWFGDQTHSLQRPRLVHQLIQAHAAQTPDAFALRHRNQSTTYATLNGMANRIAHHLLSKKIGPERRVGLCATKGVWMIAGLLGTLKAGAAYVPLDPDHPQDRLNWMIGDADLDLILCEPEVGERLPANATPVVLLCNDTFEKDHSANPETAMDPDHAAYIIFTSGSTGNPKGVLISHQSLVNAYHGWETAYGLTDGVSHHLQMAGFGFDVFSGDLVRALCSGGRLVLCPRDILLEPAKLFELIQREQIDVAEFIPAVLRLLANYLIEHNQTLAHLRLLAVGSDVWHPEDVERFMAVCGPDTRLINSYGLTEATVDSTWFELQTAAEQAVPIGKPFANSATLVLDQHLQPVPAGNPGELFIGGLGLARAYVNNPRLTAQRFIPFELPSSLQDAKDAQNPFPPGSRLYRTGDLARVLPSGDLVLLGRSDYQVKVRGYRIELGDIEGILADHSTLMQVAVVAVDDSNGDKHLVAYVQFVDDTPADQAVSDLRRHLKTNLPGYMIPRIIIPLATLPLTNNGKIDRKALQSKPLDEALLASQDDLSAPPPSTPGEIAMAGIWREVLGHHAIGVHADFFELGGHSLLATQVISRVRDNLGVDLPLRLMFETPTIAALAQQLEHTDSADDQSITRLQRDEPLPLSFAQDRLWFLEDLEEPSAMYNMAASYRLTGCLDIEALTAAFSTIVARHETLRSHFPARDGRPTVVISPSRPWRLALEDYSDHPDQEVFVKQLMDEEANRPFQLASPPLLRTRLLRLKPDHHLLLITLHHIIGDGWSVSVLMGELTVLYNHFREHGTTSTEDPLQPLPLQYVDFASWQRAQEKPRSQQLTYWKERLQDSPDLLTLPTDRPRPSQISGQGRVIHFQIDASTVQRLRDLGKRHHCTLFMVLFAAFAAMLHRLSGQNTLNIGSPIANRNRREIEGLIGFFVNTLVLRVDVSKELTFGELLQQVRKNALGAYAHQDIPFEHVVEAINPTRNLGYHPLFQVMFDFQSESETIPTLAGLEFQTIEAERVASMFDLSWTLEEEEQGLKGSVEFSTDLFRNETIDRFIARYAYLIKNLAECTATPVWRLPMIPPQEQAALAALSQAASWDDPRRSLSVAELFEARVAKTPEAEAVVWQDECLTYGELNHRANRIARELRHLPPEFPAGICSDHGLALIAGILGILKAGGVYLPLDPNYPMERLAQITGDADVPVILTLEALEDQLKPLDRNLLVMDQLSAPDHQDHPNPTPRFAPHQLAYMVFTSGSTGKPKGVAVSQTALINAYLGWERAYGLENSVRRHLQIANCSFDVFSGDVTRALLSGGKLVLCPRDYLLEPSQLYQLMVDQGVDGVEFTPALMRSLSDYLEQSNQRLDFLNMLVVGSDSWNSNDYVRFQNLCRPDTRIVNSYGVSEATIDSTWFEINQETPEDPLPIGLPFPGVTTLILNGMGQPQPMGVPGELCIAGEGLARGYLHQAGHTAERFVPLPGSKGERMYRTGDLARFTIDGQLEFIGRRDHQIKLRGFRIELDEIATVLSRHDQVSQAVVLVLDDSAGVKQLIAWVVGQSDLDTRQVQQFLRDQLPYYMVPNHVISLDAMPLNANQKIDRKALLNQAISAEPTSKHRPQNETEALLATIWSEVLDRPDISRQDNFFDLGGHSLLASRIASRISRLFAVNMPVRTIFEAPGLDQQAEWLQTAGDQPGLPAIQIVDRNQALPLSFSQEQLWLAQQMAPESTAYHMPAAIRLRGCLDVSILERVLEAIVQRHEILRSAIVVTDGQPRLVLKSSCPLVIKRVDLTRFTERTNRETSLLHEFEQEIHRPFDLETAPLFRVALFDLTDDEWLLSLTMHHVISDGWSLSILVEEVTSLYATMLAGEASALAPLPIQYADLAAWQRTWMTGDVLQRHVDHFSKKLGGDLPVLTLPLDRPRAERRSDAGERLIHKISPNLTGGIVTLGQKHGATLNMTLLAGFLILLYRTSRQTDLLLGMTVAGRNRLETESLIGCLINNLVLRFDLSERPDFLSLLNQVRQETLQAYDYQALPFEKLLEALNPPREPGVSPFFQVTFGVQSAASDTMHIDGLDIEEYQTTSETARYDLTVWVYEEEAQLRVEWTFSTDLFDRATIAGLARDFETILHHIVVDPTSGLLALAHAKTQEPDSPTTKTAKTGKAALLDKLRHKRSARKSTTVKQ